MKKIYDRSEHQSEADLDGSDLVIDLPSTHPGNDPKRNHLQVDREALTVEMRRKQYSFEPENATRTRDVIRQKCKKSVTCTKQRLWRFLLAKLPILDWLIGYDFKNWIVGDLIAGITIAIFHIPQGMGFALLANVPAICGIYMALYPVLIYAILSTSKHNSMGSFAVVTLMTGKVVKELATFPVSGDEVSSSFANVTLNETSSIEYSPIQVATIVCFMVGLFQTLFGILQLGALSVFLSDMLVSGFTTAAAFHVLTSQFKDLLGIQIPGFSGPLKIIYTYIEIFKAIPTLNLPTLIVSIVTISSIIINNELLKPIVARRTRFPVPIELLVVVIGTSASYFINFHYRFDIKIIGDIPTGLPPPNLPPMELIGKVAVDSFVIAIVAYTVSYSVAKIIGLKHGYVVEANQELYAQGLGNVFSSFFACPPMASALARTLVQEAVGGITQMVSLINCFIIIFVLLFLGPLFESLPNACLSSIIVVALKGMFMQVFDMAAMWKISKIEAITWLVTFLSVVIIDIDFGLLIGICFSLFVLIAKNQTPLATKLGRVAHLYLDMKTYPEAKEVPGLCLFRIVGAIHFANRENLKNCIVKGTGLDPKALLKRDKTHIAMELDEKGKMETVYADGYHTSVNHLVLDMSGLSYIDSAGGKLLAGLRTEYEKADIIICISGLSEPNYEVLERSGYLKDFAASTLFHSIEDAVAILAKTD